jgi:hypothetical protein
LGDVGPIPRCLQLFLEQVHKVTKEVSSLDINIIDYKELMRSTKEQVQEKYPGVVIPQSNAIICATLLRLPIEPSANIPKESITWHDLEQNGRLWIEVT